MNKIYLLPILILIAPVLFDTAFATAFAADIYAPHEVLQGDTFEVRIPKDDFVSASGTFDGRNISFFEINAMPNWDEKISRGEFLKMMFINYDCGDYNIADAAVFPDVDAENPYYEYISKASALDIIHGYEDGYFGPHTPITRGQIAKILVRAFNPGSEETDQEVLNDVPDFEDVPEDHVFYEYVQWAVSAGYFKGYPDGFMRPDRNINYSEAEIVISRAAGLPEEEIVKADSKNYFHAYAGVHRLTESGEKELEINLVNSAGVAENFAKLISVVRRDFPVNYFTLPETKTELLSKENQDDTWTKINAAKVTSADEILWDGPFIVPTDGRITLGYGDKLYINGVYSGSHFGLDYANEEGTEVYASNNGVVVLAEPTMSYGNTIVVDHGHNVFTMYLHLSEIKVEKGKKVIKGDLIGLMGSTGVATGSHLHFTHFIGDVIVSSQAWFEGKF